MQTVTTIPTVYSSIDEETRQKVQNDIYDFLQNKIIYNAEGVKEAQEKSINLFNEILPLLPEDKRHLLFKLEEAENEYSLLETTAVIKYLINHGEELKNAIVDF